MESSGRARPFAYVLVAVLALAAIWLVADDTVSRMKENAAAEAYYAAVESQTIAIRKRGKEIYAEVIDLIDEQIGQIVLLGDNLALPSPHGDLASSIMKTVRTCLLDDMGYKLRRVAEVGNIKLLGIPLANRGVTDETLREVACRAGAREILVAEDFTIPFGSDQPAVRLKDENGNPLRFAKQGSVKIGQVTIAGVKGAFHTKSEYYDPLHPVYHFGRYTYGTETPVAEGEPVRVGNAGEYKGYTTILAFSGQPSLSAEETEELARAIVAGQDAPFYVVVYNGGGETAEILRRVFQERFVSRADPLRGEDYAAVAREIYDCLDEQGCFDVLKERFGLYRGELDVLSAEREEIIIKADPFWMK